MTEHLPECPMSTKDAICCSLACVCEALRACEQRIRLADDDYAYVAGQAEADGRRRGWNEALDAAREAVAALPEYRMRDTCVSAIDALRKEKP